jgi:formiminotetrahydrofolate cyclodeaminase
LDCSLDFKAKSAQLWPVRNSNAALGEHQKMHQSSIPNFLQLPTEKLLDEFGGGRHKPGSGSAAALLGLVACKMMQTVIIVTRRNSTYIANMPQLEFILSILVDQDEPFFRDAVQRDSEQFDRYYKALVAKREANNIEDRNRCTELVLLC